MFALFDNDDAPLTVTYNGLTMNDLSDPKDSIRLDSIATQTEIRSVSDERQGTDGAEVYDARKVLRRLFIPGTLTAPNLAALYDKMRLLARTFDPALVSRENPDEHGFIALDGSLPTEDTATYPTGLIPTRLYARAQMPVQPNVVPADGYAASFVLPLICRDPRGYLQAEASADINAASVTVSNPKADYPSWPTVTITATGAGSAAFALDKSGDDLAALTINLSALSTGEEVTIDMERHTIRRNGIAAPELYVSGGWFDLDSGDNTITANDLTNLSVAMTWRPAFCL